MRACLVGPMDEDDDKNDDKFNDVPWDDLISEINRAAGEKPVIETAGSQSDMAPTRREITRICFTDGLGWKKLNPPRGYGVGSLNANPWHSELNEVRELVCKWAKKVLGKDIKVEWHD